MNANDRIEGIVCAKCARGGSMVTGLFNIALRNDLHPFCSEKCWREARTVQQQFRISSVELSA